MFSLWTSTEKTRLKWNIRSPKWIDVKLGRPWMSDHKKERPRRGERRLNETLRPIGSQHPACISSCPLGQCPGLGNQQSGQNLWSQPHNSGRFLRLSIKCDSFYDGVQNKKRERELPFKIGNESRSLSALTGGTSTSCPSSSMATVAWLSATLSRPRLRCLEALGRNWAWKRAQRRGQEQSSVDPSMPPGNF